MAGESTPIATEMRRAYENTNGALALLRWRDDVLACLAQHERDLAAARAEVERLRKDRDVLLSVCNAVIRIPDMSDEDLEQLRQSALAAKEKS